MQSHFKTRFRHFSPTSKAFVTFAIFTFFAFVIPLRKAPIDVVGVLSATSVFYSILLGFYISAAMVNLSRLKTLIATETGALIAIFQLVKIGAPQKIEEVREAIDHYIIKRFDYEIGSYSEPTTPEFHAIFDVLKGTDTSNSGETAALNYVAEGLYYVPQARREISILGATIVNSMSWLVLYVLSAVIVFLLFLMRDGSVESAIVTAFLSASAVVALFILSDVDNNRFGEEQFAVDTFEDVLDVIDKPHYYPHHYLHTGRYQPRVKNYRTGSSKNITIVGALENLLKE